MVMFRPLPLNAPLLWVQPPVPMVIVRLLPWVNVQKPLSSVRLSTEMLTLCEMVKAAEPELALMMALSAAPGTLAPLPPPSVADQLLVLFQEPVPPGTQ